MSVYTHGVSLEVRDESCQAHERGGGTIRAGAGGLALIAGGIAAGGTGGLVLALIGVVPLAAGAAGACLAAPLCGPRCGPLTGGRR